jgi:hypothetical protein
MGRVVSQAVADFPSLRPGFESVLGHVGFVVGKVALRLVFSEYSGFPWQSFLRLRLIIHHTGLVQ